MVVAVVQSYLDLSSVRSQLVPAQQLELSAFSHLTLGLGYTMGPEWSHQQELPVASLC